MSRITIDIDNNRLSAFLMLLKTLDYIEIKKVETETENALPSIDKDKLNTLSQLNGAWTDNRSAEEIIEDIYQSRIFNRTIETL